MSERDYLPAHNPGDHHQVLFGNLPGVYGTPEQQEQVNLFLAVGLDGCDACAHKLVWTMARQPELIKAMARIVMFAVGSLHGKTVEVQGTVEDDGDNAIMTIMTIIDDADIEDRAEIIISLSNTYTGEIVNIDHGPDCAECNERGEHWDAVERRG